MNPTFRPMDRLEVVPYGKSEIRRGDVVVFVSPRGHKNITHRVVDVTRGRIRTMGDNSGAIDPQALEPSSIIGQVRYVRRGKCRVRIYGGHAGRVIVSIIRVQRKAGLFISALVLHPAYNRLARISVFTQALISSRLKVISFKKGVGMEYQALIGGRVIGRILPGMRHWQIARPFRLLVNDSTLSGKISLKDR